MTNKNSKKLGFSLIELSIVILIIGILVAGITQGSKLISRSKITSARTLTQSSPVIGIKNLDTWWETTAERSFKSGQAVDGTAIDTWYDINPVADHTDASNVTAGKQPIYKENVINGLPVLRFDATDDYLQFDGNFFRNTSHTIFMVVRRAAIDATNHKYMIYANNNPAFYFTANATGAAVGDPQINGAITIPAFSTAIPQIFTKLSEIDPAAPRSAYFLNGGVALYDTASAATGSGATASFIGNNSSTATVTGLNGDIGEIIVFDRALTKSEREDILQYLSKKWTIKVTSFTS